MYLDIPSDPPGCPPGKRSIWEPAAPGWVFPTPCVAKSTRGMRGAQAERMGAPLLGCAPHQRRMGVAHAWQAFGIRAASAAHGCPAGRQQAGHGRRIGRAVAPVVATFRPGRVSGHCFRFARNERSLRSQSKLAALQRIPDTLPTATLRHHIRSLRDRDHTRPNKLVACTRKNFFFCL